MNNGPGSLPGDVFHRARGGLPPPEAKKECPKGLEKDTLRSGSQKEKASSANWTTRAQQCNSGLASKKGYLKAMVSHQIPSVKVRAGWQS